MMMLLMEAQISPLPARLQALGYLASELGQRENGNSRYLLCSRASVVLLGSTILNWFCAQVNYQSSEMVDFGCFACIVVLDKK